MWWLQNRKMVTVPLNVVWCSCSLSVVLGHRCNAFAQHEGCQLTRTHSNHNSVGIQEEMLNLVGQKRGETLALKPMIINQASLRTRARGTSATPLRVHSEHRTTGAGFVTIGFAERHP